MAPEEPKAQKKTFSLSAAAKRSGDSQAAPGRKTAEGKKQRARTAPPHQSNSKSTPPHEDSQSQRDEDRAASPEPEPPDAECPRPDVRLQDYGPEKGGGSASPPLGRIGAPEKWRGI